MFNASVTRIGGSTAATIDPCRGATMPNVVGKSIKEVKRETVTVGNKTFTAISLVLSDGSKVMAANFKPGQQQGAPDPGMFVIADSKNCVFAVV